MKQQEAISRSGLVALSVGIALLISSRAKAEDFQYQYNPEVELGGQVNDNYRLLLPDRDLPGGVLPPGIHRSVAGGFVDAGLQLRAVDDVDDIKLTPAIHATDFPGAKEDNTTDPLASLDWTHRTQKFNAGLDATYARQSDVETLTGAETAVTTGTVGAAPGTPQGGLGNPSTADAGFVTLNNRQQTINVNPQASMQMTERRSLQLSANYIDVSFNHVVAGQSVGFKNYGGSVGLQQQVTQRDDLTLRGIYAHNDPDSTPGPIQTVADTNSYGVEGEWRRRFSQRAEAYVRLGDEYSSFGAVNGKAQPNLSTWVAGVGVDWTYQVSHLFFDATRTIEPSVIGVTVELDEVRFRFTRDFSAKLSGLIQGSGLIDKANGGAAAELASFRERRYATSSVGFKYRFTRAFTLQGTYTYIWQKFEFDPASAVSNGALLSVVWQPYKDRK